MFRPDRFPVWLTAMAVAATCMAVAPAHAAPKQRPDLVVASLKLSAASAPSGSRLTITVKTTNKGKANAPKSTTRVLLSKTANGGRTLVDVRVPALKKGKSATVSRTVTVPGTTGLWKVIAAADALDKVKESAERNNRRNRNLRITPVPAPAPPFSPAPAPPFSPAPAPTPSPTTTPRATPTPTTTPRATPTPTTTPQPGGWPAGLKVEVSLPAGPVELFPVTRELDMTVRATNTGATATAATAGELVLSGFPDDLPWWETDGPQVSIPALAPGQQVEIPVPVSLPIDTPAGDVPFTLGVRFRHDAYDGPSSSVALVVLGEWALPDLSAAVTLPFDEIVIGPGGTFGVQVKVTNSGGGPSLPESGRLYHDCSFCGWTGWRPQSPDVELPSVPAGGEVELTFPLTLPPFSALTAPSYAGKRWTDSLRAWFFSYGTGESPRVSAGLRFVPAFNGRNLAVRNAVLPSLLGASAERPYRFAASVDVANVGTQDPGDRVHVTAAILPTPTWDPSVPEGSFDHVEYSTLDVGESRKAVFDLSWDGPAPATPRYLVVCVDAVPESVQSGYIPLEETTVADNCAAQELSFVDLDALLAPADGPSGVFPHPPEPASVTVTPAEEPAFAAAFSWQQTADQTWNLTAGDGVQAQVTVPHGVFVEDFELTGTPVTLTDLPIESVLGAFELAPGDLLANAPLTVRFTLDSAANVADQVVFTADSDGSNFRLAPIVANPGGGYSATVLTAGLDHLGIVGIGTATPAQREALAEAWPAGDDQQIELLTAVATQGMRRDALAGGATARGAARSMARAEDWDAWFVARMTAWWNDKVLPAFNAAAAPNATELALYTAVNTFLPFERALQLAGVAEHPPWSTWSAEGHTRMFDAINRYADRVKARCQAGQVDAVPDMLNAMRMLQLWGMEAKSAELDTALPQCTRYRVSVGVTFVGYHVYSSGEEVLADSYALLGTWEPQNGGVRDVFFSVLHWEVWGQPWEPPMEWRRFGLISETKYKPNRRRGVGSTVDFLIGFGLGWTDLSPLLWQVWQEDPDNPSPYPRYQMPYGPRATVRYGSPYKWTLDYFAGPEKITATVEINIRNLTG